MTFLVIEALMEILLCFVVVEACNSSSAQLFFFVFFQKNLSLFWHKLVYAKV